MELKTKQKISPKIYLFSGIFGIITLFLPIFSISMNLSSGSLNGSGLIVESWLSVIGLDMFQNAQLYIPPSGFYIGLCLLIGIYICLTVFLFEFYDVNIFDRKLNAVLGMFGGFLTMFPSIILFIFGFMDINVLLNLILDFPLDIFNFNLQGIGFYGTGAGEIVIGPFLFEFTASWSIFIGQIIGIIGGSIPIIYEILEMIERKKNKSI
ncbi:MAG: hypothetical protein EAX96_05085 [Candidatus Lokiarchaeota archaeon]|nr:hypothetical protein [Candidatus Lokiarchaeota archaeon]